MNILEAQCLDCPAKHVCKKPQEMPDGELRMQTCPPQNRAIRINTGTNPKSATMSDKEAKSELSRLTQEVNVIYHCPLSEKRRFVSPLLKRIHPGRSELFNSAFIPSLPIIDGYEVELQMKRSAFFADTKRFNKGRRTVGGH
jgi:hypothetical protein